ncbi:Serine/threonine-protein phosphatase PP-X isozyme 2 [Bienertia sinuspersici]
MSDLDRQIEQLKRCEPLKESEVKALCLKAMEILVEESNVQRVDAPVTICGDIHGQFYDMKELFKVVVIVRRQTTYFLEILLTEDFTPSRLSYFFLPLRKQEVPHDGAMCDLLWSDPEEAVDGWGMSPRGAGYLFGGSVVTTFNHDNNIDYICRAHQLVMEGYKWMFNHQIVTVWSAPNYCYRCGNVAAILELDENLKREFRVFQAAPQEARGTPAKKPAPDYFL